MAITTIDEAKTRLDLWERERGQTKIRQKRVRIEISLISTVIVLMTKNHLVWSCVFFFYSN